MFPYNWDTFLQSLKIAALYGRTHHRGLVKELYDACIFWIGVAGLDVWGIKLKQKWLSLRLCLLERNHNVPRPRIKGWNLDPRFMFEGFSLIWIQKMEDAVAWKKTIFDFSNKVSIYTFEVSFKTVAKQLAMLFSISTPADHWAEELDCGWELHSNWQI